MRAGAEGDVCEEEGQVVNIVTERELAVGSEGGACEAVRVLLRSGGSTQRGCRVVGVDTEM